MKEYSVIYKFSDVIDTIEAETQEEAERMANEKLLSDYNPQNDTYCYEVEVEEVDHLYR